MDFELLPTISLRSRSFNVLQAPRELFIQTLNRNLNLQRFKVLYICGNYSGILSKLDRRFQALEIRRAIKAGFPLDLIVRTPADLPLPR